MSRYGSRRYHKYGKRSIGHEMALEHIRQAENLSRELGGTDEDVKKYFFSLTPMQLNEIFNEYESKYGRVKREYAQKILPKWKTNEVHMSGLVAERLFSLLPPKMPMEVKYQLTESLWKHVGPCSTKIFYVNPEVNIDDVCNRVKAYLEEIVISYEIPKNMETRFVWLSQGDVVIKQQLLNHFRQLEKQLLSSVLNTQLPQLLSHMNSEKGRLTTHIAQILKVGKHEVRIVIDKKADGITDIYRSSQSSDSWIWWIIGIIILSFLLMG